MTVAGGERETQLGWDLSFDIADESVFPMIKAALERMYQAGSKGPEEFSQ